MGRRDGAVLLQPRVLRQRSITNTPPERFKPFRGRVVFTENPERRQPFRVDLQWDLPDARGAASASAAVPGADASAPAEAREDEQEEREKEEQDGSDDDRNENDRGKSAVSGGDRRVGVGAAERRAKRLRGEGQRRPR